MNGSAALDYVEISPEKYPEDMERTGTQFLWSNRSVAENPFVAVVAVVAQRSNNRSPSVLVNLHPRAARRHYYYGPSNLRLRPVGGYRRQHLPMRHGCTK